MSSEFKVEVIIVGGISKHPKADLLSLTTVNGQTVIIKTGEIETGDLAVYIPEDAVVPLGKVFEFLRKKETDITARVKAIRLRGIYSEGLLIKADRLGVTETPGTDVGPKLGIVKYEQPVDTTSRIAMTAAKVSIDPGCAPRYDVENFLKYSYQNFQENLQVVVTEKIHGSNFRAVFKGGELHVGSHNVFRAPPFKPSKVKGFFSAIKSAFLIGSKKYTFKENWARGFEAMATERKIDPWWLITKRLGLGEKLKLHPGMVLYGEIYGQIQDLKYSVSEEDVVHFAAFDVFDSNKNKWLSYEEFLTFCKANEIPTVPELFSGPYNRESISKLRSGKSTIDGVTLREGFVIRPLVYPEGERLSLKYVSEDYKLRNGGTEFH